MHAVCTEVTGQILGDRRQRLLHDLSTAGARLGDERDTVAAMCGALEGGSAGRSLRRRLPLRSPVRQGSGGSPRWAATPHCSAESTGRRDRGPARARRAARASPAARSATASPRPSSSRSPPRWTASRWGCCSPGEAPTAPSTRPTGPSTSSWPASSPARSPTSAPSRPSGCERSPSPSSTARRPPSSPTSATSCGRRSPCCSGPSATCSRTPSEPLPPAVQEQLTLALRNGQRLQRLVNDLLDFASIEAGRASPVRVQTDVATFTAELAGIFRAATERAGLRLTVDCPPLDRPAFVDPRMWEKVVVNLLANAVKYTFVGGIDVAVRPDGDALRAHRRPTPASGSSPRSCPSCSTASTGSPAPRPAPGRAPGSAWRWCTSSRPCTAATSRSRASRAPGSTFTVTLPYRRARRRRGRPPPGRRPVRRRARRGAELGGRHLPAQRARDTRVRRAACWSSTTTPTCAPT